MDFPLSHSFTFAFVVRFVREREMENTQNHNDRVEEPLREIRQARGKRGDTGHQMEEDRLCDDPRKDGPGVKWETYFIMLPPQATIGVDPDERG